MHNAAQVGPRGQDDRLRLVRDAKICHYARHVSRLRCQPFHALLLERQSRLVLKYLFHAGAVLPLVALRAHALHSAPLGGVEQLDLSECPLGVQAHLATQGIDFTHHLRLARPPDSRIARHPGDAVQRTRQDQHTKAGPCRCKRGLAPRVSGSHHDAVVLPAGPHCLVFCVHLLVLSPYQFMIA